MGQLESDLSSLATSSSITREPGNRSPFLNQGSSCSGPYLPSRMSAPILVYDDDCGFCTWWARFFARHGNLEVIGFSDLDDALTQRLPADYRACSHVVTDNAVYSCGASIEQAIAHSRLEPIVNPILTVLRRFGMYRALREGGYHAVARRRDLWGKVRSMTTSRKADDSTRSNDR